MNFDFKQKARPSNRDKSMKKVLNSPATMASGISTIFLPENLIDLCDKLKILIHEKQAGNNSNIFNEEIVAIVEKVFEYNCMSKNQQKQILIECNLLHTKKK